METSATCSTWRTIVSLLSMIDNAGYCVDHVRVSQESATSVSHLPAGLFNSFPPFHQPSIELSTCSLIRLDIYHCGLCAGHLH
jgi:hypothetical protein